MSDITIRDIAKLCGVGVSTVSRAMNDHPDINPETKAKIMQVIEEHNYIPNNSARNLKRSESNTIALLMKGIDNPFFQGMFHIFEEMLSRKDYAFILQKVGFDEDEINVALELEKEKTKRNYFSWRTYSREHKRFFDAWCAVYIMYRSPATNAGRKSGSFCGD